MRWCRCRPPLVEYTLGSFHNANIGRGFEPSRVAGNVPSGDGGSLCARRRSRSGRARGAHCFQGELRL